MNTSRQLKDLINNKAKKYNLNSQILLTKFFMERFLERISLSEYRNSFILKGGILIASLFGVDSRITKDMDLTAKDFLLDESHLRTAIEKIIKLEIDDGTSFNLLDLRPIREEFDYPGYRIRLSCQLDKTRNVIQIDITTGDVITPCEMIYNYDLLIEKRNIKIACYPIETILAEKLESILSKNIANTRMKDFYDCYMLNKLYIDKINSETALAAIKNTAKTRNTEFIFNNIDETMELISNDENLQFLWTDYSLQFDYARNIKYEDIMYQIKTILQKIKLL